jgi:hypothetical protein
MHVLSSTAAAIDEIVRSATIVANAGRFRAQLLGLIATWRDANAHWSEDPQAGDLDWALCICRDRIDELIMRHGRYGTLDANKDGEVAAPETPPGEE